MYERFIELVKRKGLKVADVSRGTGIRSGFFTDWKMHRYLPKHEKLEKIAAFLGVPVEYLTKGEVPEGKVMTGEAAKVAQAICDREELNDLFAVAVESHPQDVQLAASMLKRLKAYSKLVDTKEVES